MKTQLAHRHGLVTLLLLLLTTLIFLAPALRPGHVLLAADLPYLLDPLWQPLAPPGAVAKANPVLGDQFYQFHPWQVAAWEMLMGGEWPTWNPAINGGQPLFGNGLAGILSPFNLISRLVPFPLTYLVSALLRLWVAGGFTYLYARSIGLSLAASWLAMVVFALSGPVVSWLWGTPSHVLAWLPALLWAGEKLLNAPTMRRALAAAGVLALLIFSAQPEMAFQLGIVWGVYLLCRAAWIEGSFWAGLRRHIRWWLLVALLGMALAAVEVLGFLDALRHSVILHHRQVIDVAGGAAWLHRVFLDWQEWPTLVTTLLPHFLGREKDNSDWYPVGNSIENNAYAGVLPLLLALLALWAGWRRASAGPRRRWIWLWGGIGFGALALALNFPLVAAIGDLPPFNLTLLSRLRGVYVFAVAMLAAFGLDLLLGQPLLRRPFLYLLVAAAIINLLLVAAAYAGFTLFADRLIASGRAFMEANVGSPALDRPLEELYALVDTRQQARLAMLRPNNPVMYLPLLVAVVVGLFWWLQRQRPSRTWLAPALIFITWLDLLWTGAEINTAVPAAWLEPLPPAVEYLQHQEGMFRVVGTHLILNPNMSMLTHLEDVRGYDALAVNRYRDLLAGIDGFAPAGYHNYFSHLDDPRLDLLNARYGLSRTPPIDPRWQPVFDDPSGVTVYRSQSALPRAYLVYAAEVVGSAEQSLAATLDPTFDPRLRVILEQSPAGWTPPANAPGETPQVELSERRASRIELAVNTPVPALLVLLDSYTPGWRATVDNQPATIYPANHAFRAVVVPAGQHTVAFTYAPPLLVLGAAISVAALFVVLALTLWLLYAKHREERAR